MRATNPGMENVQTWLRKHPRGYVRLDLDTQGRLLLAATDAQRWLHLSPPMVDISGVEKFMGEVLKYEKELEGKP